MESTCNNTTQFSTLVLRAGRTSLPSLRVQACETPVDSTSLGCSSSFGQTKIRLESVRQPINLTEIYTERNGRSICPRHGMSAAQPSASAYHLMPVLWCPNCPSELRDTYGRSFVIKDLPNLTMTAAHSSTGQQDGSSGKDGLDFRGAWFRHS